MSIPQEEAKRQRQQTQTNRIPSRHEAPAVARALVTAAKTERRIETNGAVIHRVLFRNAGPTNLEDFGTPLQSNEHDLINATFGTAALAPIRNCSSERTASTKLQLGERTRMEDSLEPFHASRAQLAPPLNFARLGHPTTSLSLIVSRGPPFIFLLHSLEAHRASYIKQPNGA